jgi:hypothetical protein
MLLVLVTLGMSLSSCIWEWGDIFGKGDRKDPSAVTLHLVLPQSFTVSSKAAFVVDEKEIGEVYVLAFEPGSAGALKFLKEADVVTGEDNSTATITLNPDEVKAEDARYDLWVIANVPANRLAIPLGTTQESARKLLLYSEADGVTQTGSGYVPIPLWGRSLEVQLLSSGIQPVEKSTVNLIRSVAKIEFQLSEGEYPVELLHVYYHHRWTSGLVVPVNVESDGKSVTLPTLPELGGGEAPLGGFDHSYLDGVIYTFESPGGGVQTSPVDEPCLVLGAYFDGSEIETYYRVDFLRYDAAGVKDESSYDPVLRDHLYSVTADAIADVGAATPEEALLNAPLSASVRVINWKHEIIDIDDLR